MTTVLALVLVAAFTAGAVINARRTRARRERLRDQLIAEYRLTRIPTHRENA